MADVVLLDGFFVTVHALAAHEALKVHEVTVKFRTVDAGEFRLIANRHAAAAAHARAVHHNRVEGNDRMNAEVTRRVGHALHHDDRTNRRNLRNFLAAVHESLYSIRDKALDAVRTVIRRHEDFVRHGLHLIFHNKDVFILCPHNGNDLIAGFLHSTRNRIRRGNADAAAHDNHRAVELLDFRRTPQRTDEVKDIIAFIQGRQLHRRSPDGLKDNQDAPRLAVIIGNRQRDAFALLIDAQHNELTGLRFFRDTRCLDVHRVDIRRPFLFFQDLKHGSLSYYI